jgi:carboxypeptidase Q
VAALTRSATGRSLLTPHTGALRYDEEQPQIPAAALSVEDADWLRRMAERGHEVTVRLEMGARMLPDAESFNVIAEIPGSERPEEVVVMGGHYDSWDVGEGVHDDGAACVAAWQALRLIQQLGLRPRRTLRVVLWTNEENGLRGGSAYRDALSEQEVADHVAAIEMDGGAERPTGFGFGLVGVDPEAETPDPVYERALALLGQIGRLLAPIDAGGIERGGGGADIGPLMRSGVPGMGLRTVGEHYFDWHHTHADTLDKLDREDFRRAIALLGVTGYVLADMPERLVPEGWQPPAPTP